MHLLTIFSSSIKIFKQCTLLKCVIISMYVGGVEVLLSGFMKRMADCQKCLYV